MIISNVTTIGRLVRGPQSFAVPPYQRNYMWGIPEYSAFWKDIWRAVNTQDSQYLLGFVVFTPKENGDFQLIDGQQRLSTTLILLSALRAHFLAANKTRQAKQIEKQFLLTPGGLFSTPRPRLTLNFKDNDFFQQNIIARKPVEELIAKARNNEQPPSNQAIAACFWYMYRQIERLLREGQQIEQLGQVLISGLLDKIAVIHIRVPDDINAFQVFETLNQRGLELNEDNLIKNHVYSHAEGAFVEVQRNWETMEENLEDLAPSHFIAYHWQATQKRISVPQGILFDIKCKVTNSKQAQSYTAELAEKSRLFAALRNPDHPLWRASYPDDAERIRKHVRFIRGMRAEQLMIVLLAALLDDQGHFPDILELMTIFTFRFTTICGRPPSKLSATYIAAAKEIRRQQGKMSAQQLFDQFLARLYPDDEEFQRHFATRSIPRNANLVRHILAELNDHINGEAVAARQVEAGQVDLEHILPIKFSEYWRVSADEFPGGPERYRHRLGNMTLVPIAVNQAAANLSFREKLKYYKTDPLDITADVLSQKSWGAKQIDERQKRMAEIAVKIWRYP